MQMPRSKSSLKLKTKEWMELLNSSDSSSNIRFNHLALICITLVHTSINYITCTHGVERTCSRISSYSSPGGIRAAASASAVVEKVGGGPPWRPPGGGGLFGCIVITSLQPWRLIIMRSSWCALWHDGFFGMAASSYTGNHFLRLVCPLSV